MADTSLSLNMKQVIQTLENHPDLTAQQKQTYILSVEKICEWLDLPPEKVTTRKVELRPAIERLNASQLGIKRKTFRNRIASFNSALKYGADGQYRETLTQPNQAWVSVLDMIDTYWRRQKILQLARFASHVGLAPSDIAADFFVDWLAWRQEHAPLLTKPERSVEDAWSVWNWCAKNINNWPTAVIPRPSRKRTVRLDRNLLPEVLIAELNAFEERMTRDADDDLLSSAPSDPVNIVAPQVARNRILAIEQCVTCLVETGTSAPEDYKSIADIVCADHAHKLINWVRARNGNAYTHYHRSLLEHLRAVAAQYIGFETMKDGVNERAKYNHMIKIVSDKVGHGKMTKGNKDRLTQFDNPENIARLVNLAQKIFYNLEIKRSKSGFVTCQMAYESRAAIAILVMLTLPLRRANLVDLRIGKELHLPTSKHDCAKLVIDGETVKNDQDMTCIVPDHALTLIEIYLKWYRPVLIAGQKLNTSSDMRFGDGDHYLLPVKGGGPIDGGKLRAKLVVLVKKETGLDVTVHFFRHFAASMIMKANPALAAAAGAILGHKDGSRVTRVYTKLSSETAANTFETVKSDLAKPKKRKTPRSSSRLNRVRRNHVY